MPDFNRYVVIGLGSFGSAYARRLKKNGIRVTGIDADPAQVDACQEFLFEAVIGDATDRETLASLHINRSNSILISLGEDITRSLLATLHARELGAKRVIVKGVTAEHGRLLRHLGVERVVFPEIEIAEQLADRITWPNVVDFVQIDREYTFMEIAMPDDLVSKQLMETDLRKRFNLYVVGIKDAMTGKLSMFPDGNFRMSEDQILLLVGKEEDLKKFREVYCSGS